MKNNLMSIEEKLKVRELIQKLKREKLNIDEKYFSDYSVSELLISSEIQEGLTKLTEPTLNFKKSSLDVIQYLTEELQDITNLNEGVTDKFLYKNLLNNIKYLVSNLVFNLGLINENENIKEVI